MRGVRSNLKQRPCIKTVTAFGVDSLFLDSQMEVVPMDVDSTVQAPPDIPLAPASYLPLSDAQPNPPVSPPPRASSVPLHNPDATVGFVFSTEMTTHCSLSPDGHPESPTRIIRIWNAIVAKHYTLKTKRIPIRPVHKQEALLVHSEDLWDKIEAIQREFLPACLPPESEIVP